MLFSSLIWKMVKNPHKVAPESPVLSGFLLFFYGVCGILYLPVILERI